MDIVLKRVEGRKSLRAFVRFPMDLYADSPYYVPAILKDEEAYWDSEINPSLADYDYQLVLAQEKDRVVGRIALIFPKMGEKKAKFGWFDCIENYKVAEVLLEYAVGFCKEKGAISLEGALGFTNLDQAGFLTEGFCEKATPIGLYNASYYVDFLEKFGFKEEKEWVEYKIEVPQHLSPKVERFNSLIREKYGLSPVSFRNKKEIGKYTAQMFELLEETYRVLPTFTPLSPAQKRFYIDRYGELLLPDYVSCIANAEGKLVAFAITMPAYGEALQKAKGKVFPFGWWHIFQATKKNDTANFYLIGIHPDFQKKGITSIIFDDIFKKYKKNGIKHIETNPELADNKSVQVLWQDYAPVLHKRRKTFKISFV